MALTLPVALPQPTLPHGVRRMVPIAWLPPAVGALASAVATQLLDGTPLWVALGGIWTAAAWSQIATLVVWTRHREAVQPTTAQVLRPLRKHGWRVAEGPTVGTHRVDHLAVGPGGVLVVGTKTRTNPTGDDLHWAAAQVRRSRREVVSRVGHIVGDAPVFGLVVVWGAGDVALPPKVDGVSIVKGQDLAAWLDETVGWLDDIDADLIAPSVVEMAWARVS